MDSSDTQGKAEREGAMPTEIIRGGFSSQFKADVNPSDSQNIATSTSSTTKINHGARLTPESISSTEEEVRQKESLKVTLFLFDPAIPSLAYNLNKSYAKVTYKEEELLTLISKLTNGVISTNPITLEKAPIAEILPKLEWSRVERREKLASYVEVPAQSLVNLVADELERKLYARHFRNKAAQKRVFMIGFYFAVFSVGGAFTMFKLGEATETLIEIALAFGLLTTALGTIGHILMRLSNLREEKFFVRSIQELTLLDNTIDKLVRATR